MRKSDIEKLARRRGTDKDQPIAPDARERAQKRAQAQAVDLSRETINALAEAVAEAVCARLARLLPIMARLAAADTIHTVERSDKVFRRAIDEGRDVLNMLEGNV